MAKKSKVSLKTGSPIKQLRARWVVAMASVFGLGLMLAGLMVSTRDPMREKKLSLSPTQISDDDLKELIQIGIATGDRKSSDLLTSLRDVPLETASRMWIWPEDYLHQLWVEITQAPEAVRSSQPYQALARWIGTRLGLTQ